MRAVFKRLKQTALFLACLLFFPGMHANLAEENQATSSKAGYKSISSLEGPDGVASELAQDDIDVGAVFRPPLLDGTLQPWFDLKREWNEKYGLQLGFSYNALYQGASETSTLEDAAAAGRFQGQGMWTLLGRETKNPGILSFRVEDRHRLGTEIPPGQLSQQFGSANVSGAGFSDFEFALTELAWRQTFLDGKMKFGFGKISAVSWYNAYALSSALTGFQNSAIRSSATKPSVGRGFGTVAGFRLGENFALLTGIHDANAVTSENPFDTIDKTDFYYSTELRWFPTTFDRRKWDQVRLQAWYVDESHGGATPSGYGATITASRLYDDCFMPFFLAGFSDGGASIIKTDATAGIAFAFNTKHRAARDVLALSVNWGSPFDNSLNEQLTSELFYRFQLFKNLAFTPSIQYVANPSYNSIENSVWLAGIRGRMTF